MKKMKGRILPILVGLVIGISTTNFLLRSKIQNDYIPASTVKNDYVSKSACIDFAKAKVTENTQLIIQQLSQQQPQTQQSPLDLMNQIDEYSLNQEMLRHYKNQNFQNFIKPFQLGK